MRIPVRPTLTKAKLYELKNFLEENAYLFYTYSALRRQTHDCLSEMLQFIEWLLAIAPQWDATREIKI